MRPGRLHTVSTGSLVAVACLIAALSGCGNGDDDNGGKKGKGKDKDGDKSKGNVVVEEAPPKRKNGNPPAAPQTRPATSRPSTKLIGRIKDEELTESSGVAASRRHPGVYWTHNDSGGRAELFAIDRTGKVLATFPVAAPNRDWEDIAIDDAGNLYIADIGNNDGNYKEVDVYKVEEPDPTKVESRRGKPLRLSARYKLKYPIRPFDAEALFIWQGHGYVIAKETKLRSAPMYRFDLSKSDEPQTFEEVGEFATRAPVTGADISPDGKWLAAITVAGPYVARIDGDPTKAANAPTDYVRLIRTLMEAVTFTPEGLLATTEEGDVLMFPYGAFNLEGLGLAPTAAATRPAD